MCGACRPSLPVPFGHQRDLPHIRELGELRVIHAGAAPLERCVHPGAIQHGAVRFVIGGIERCRFQIWHQAKHHIHGFVAVFGVERRVPAARLHLVEPVAAIAAEQGDKSPACPRAALQGGPDHARFAALAQFLRDRDDVVPGLRGLQPGLFENVRPIVLHLTVTVRRQPIQLAAFRRRFVAIQVEHVLRDVGENVLLVFRIFVEIGLEALQRALSDELRRVVVVVENHVIAV